jgi:5'-3' exonuclease
MEADDCIAAYCQQNASPEHEVIIISGDKDFVQLLVNDHVKLLNQREGKYRNQPGDKFYYEDLKYFIFEKSVRGDKGDWVFSAYPKVRETKIRKAYEDEYFRVNFMNETWKEKLEDGTTVEHRVGDLFEENKMLVDLTCQPDDIKKELHDEVKRLTTEFAKYSDFHFLKFLGQFKLKKITEEIHKFQDVFIRNSQHAAGKLQYRDVKHKDEVDNVEQERTKTKTLAELQLKSKSNLFQF